MAPVAAILTATTIPTAAPKPSRQSLPFAPSWAGTPAGGAFAVECSSRPQKKATKHHMKTRPKKTHPWDIKRRPTQYPPLPPLPPDWTLVAAGAPTDAEPPSEAGGEVAVATAAAE